MLTLSRPDAVLEYEVHGAGLPVTVFAHGLGGSIAETRPLGSGVGGTKVFFHFRGHGHSVAWGSAGWDYPALAGDLRAICDTVEATQVLGVSMGAGALQSLLAQTPDRLDRCVFFLPGAMDKPRTDAAAGRLAELATLVDAGDLIGLQRVLAADLPEAVRESRPAQLYLASRARSLAGTSVSRLLRGIPRVTPVASRELLRAVSADCLVIGQEHDPLHPAALARALASALGPTGSPCEVFPEFGAMWNARARLRLLIAGGLSLAR